MAKYIDIKNRKNSRVKRENGEGSISRRKDGRYMAKITVGKDLNGKIIRKSVYGKTKGEVIAKKTQIMAKVFKGIYNEPTKITIEQWLNTWYNTYKKMYIKPQTRDLYEMLMRAIIVPRIGNMKLVEIKQMHLQELINRLKKDGYSTSTLYKIKNIINPAMKIAKVNKLIEDNPFENIQMPPQDPSSVKALDRKEQARFESLVHTSYFYEVFITALDTGLRTGELLALNWEDIDFFKKEISVTKTIILEKDEITGKKVLKVQNTPKTDSSNRTVSMTKRCIKTLNNLIKKRRSDNFNDNNIVFCSKVGTLVYPKNLRRSLKIIFDKAKINKSGAHILRHSFATRLFEENVSVKTISKMLGHSCIEITLNTYTHVFKECEEKAIECLENLDLGESDQDVLKNFDTTFDTKKGNIR